MFHIGFGVNYGVRESLLKYVTTKNILKTADARKNCIPWQNVPMNDGVLRIERA